MGDSPRCACVDFPPRFLTYRKKKHSTDNWLSVECFFFDLSLPSIMWYFEFQRILSPKRV